MMPTPQRLPTPARDEAAVAPREWPQLVAEALAHAVDGAGDATADAAALYHRTFPLGEAIGELFKRRAARGSRPLGLAELIAALAPAADEVCDGACAQARQALLAGLCWNLEDVVALGSRLRDEFGQLPPGDPLDAARARARHIAGELGRRKR